MTSHCVETANIFTIHISDRKNHFISIPFRHIHTDNSVNLKNSQTCLFSASHSQQYHVYIKLCVILYMTNLATATPFIMLAHRLTTFIRRFIISIPYRMQNFFCTLTTSILIYRTTVCGKTANRLCAQLRYRPKKQNLYKQRTLLFFSTGIIIYLLFVLYNSFYYIIH